MSCSNYLQCRNRSSNFTRTIMLGGCCLVEFQIHWGRCKSHWQYPRQWLHFARDKSWCRCLKRYQLRCESTHWPCFRTAHSRPHSNGWSRWRFGCRWRRWWPRCHWGNRWMRGWGRCRGIQWIWQPRWWHSLARQGLPWQRLPWWTLCGWEKWRGSRCSN